MTLLDMLKDPIYLRRFTVIVIWIGITSATLPFLQKWNGTFLSYAMLTGASLLLASGGIFEPYFKNRFKSTTIRNVVIFLDLCNLTTLFLLYNQIKHYGESGYIANEHLIIGILCADILIVAMRGVLCGVLGKRIRGYISNRYTKYTEDIWFNEDRAMSFATLIFGVGSIVLYTFGETFVVLVISAIAIITCNIYDLMATKSLILLDKHRSRYLRKK